MKLQYLGDSKDSFKWDYLDFLMSETGYSTLNIAIMMTPDDGGNDGNLHATLYPARSEIIEFCEDLRRERYTGTVDEAVGNIKHLPAKSSASYEVSLHKGAQYFTNENRDEYFLGFDNTQSQLVFLDPDNGLEPEIRSNQKHVRYADITRIMEQLTDDSVVTVFQHHRRIAFSDDYARIKERVEKGYTTAIYWYSLMFVSISKSKTAISKVITANKKYAGTYPVKVIAEQEPMEILKSFTTPEEYFPEMYLKDFETLAGKITGTALLCSGLFINMKKKEHDRNNYKEFFCCQYALNLINQGIHCYFRNDEFSWQTSSIPFLDMTKCYVHHGGISYPKDIMRYVRLPSEMLASYAKYFFFEYLPTLKLRKVDSNDLISFLQKDDDCKETLHLFPIE